MSAADPNAERRERIFQSIRDTIDRGWTDESESFSDGAVDDFTLGQLIDMIEAIVDDEMSRTAGEPIITRDQLDLYKRRAADWLEDRVQLSAWLHKESLVMMQILDQLACQPVEGVNGLNAAIRAVSQFHDAATRLLGVLPSAKPAQPAEEAPAPTETSSGRRPPVARAGRDRGPRS